MVTYINRVTSWEHPYMEYRGLSTDTKPTDAPVNAKFVELDTGAEYYFSGGTWNVSPVQSGSGGNSSSSGGGAEKFVVTLIEDNDEWTSDKTIAEVAEAFENNLIVVAKVYDGHNYVEVPVVIADNDEEEPFVTCYGSNVDSTIIVNGEVKDGSSDWSVEFVDSIPEFSDSENGKVLGVHSGALAWVDKGNDRFAVTLTKDDEWTADQSIADIIAAFEANKCCVALVDLEGSFYELPIVRVENGEDLYVDFEAPYIDKGVSVVSVCGSNTGDGDEWEYDETEIIELPYSSSRNNGQVLSVVNGDPEWVDPDSGVASWNDLEDKPFYEETVPSVTLSMPDMGAAEYISGTYGPNGMEISVRLYRVGDALSAEQLAGISLETVYSTVDGGEPFSGTDISEPSIHDVTDANNDVIYTAIANDKFDIYVACVVYGDNVTINTNYLNVDDVDSGTYLMYLDVGKDEYIYGNSLTTASQTTVHQIDSKFIPCSNSWDDLTNKPFYEETTPAINLEIPTGASYVEASFVADIEGQTQTIPMKLYRAGGVYTPEQLIGATGVIDYDGDTITSVLNAEAFIEIEQDGETVGYLVAGNGLLAFIVFADNTVFDTNMLVYGDAAALTSDNIPTAGTYLINYVVDIEGTCTSITKAGTTTVHKLDAKFLPDETDTPNIPSYSSSQNGKVLGVEDGDLAWVDAASSWENLEDKPFYEENIPSVVYEPESETYISGTASVPGALSVPLKLYYTGQTAAIEDLVGAEVDYTIWENNLSSSTPMTYTLISDSITPLTNGALAANLDETVMMVACIVTTEDNMTYVDEPIGTSGLVLNATLPDAGVYIVEGDLSAFAELSEGNYITATNSITIPARSVVHKIDAKYIPSWNDIPDVPFYERTVQGINLEVQSGASYEEGNVAIHIQNDNYLNCPLKLYRVGDVYTTEQLVGATATINYSTGSTESLALDAERTVAIEENDSVIAYIYCTDETGMTAIVVLEDYTMFNNTLSVGGITGILTSSSLDAGTYLLEVDMSGGDMPVLSCVSLVKGNGTSLRQIDPKFIPNQYAPLVVTLTNNNGNIVGDKTYGEMFEAMSCGRNVVAVMEGAGAIQILNISVEYVENSTAYDVLYATIGSAGGELKVADGGELDYFTLA